MVSQACIIKTIKGPGVDNSAALFMPIIYFVLLPLYVSRQHEQSSFIL